MIPIVFPEYDFKIKQEEGRSFIFDLVRKKYVILSPEEWVRQHILHYLVGAMQYPRGLISVEKEIIVNRLRKRYDIVVFSPDRIPWMLVECKEPAVAISDQTLKQLLRYHQTLQCPFWMLSNGRQHYCAQIRDAGPKWLAALPSYDL
jgi:hypothetical protein